MRNYYYVFLVVFFAKANLYSQPGRDMPYITHSLVLHGVCYDSTTIDRLGALVIIVDHQTNDTLYNREANSTTGEYTCVLPPNANGQLGGNYVLTATYNGY